MGFRFRKSINLGKHFRINLSKNGVGYSYGVKGYRRTISADGKKKDTYTLPGTGISYTSSTKSPSGSSGSRKNADSHPRSNNSGVYYFISFISLLIAIGCAFSRSTFGIFLFVILAFLFCVAGKKAKWAYEDYLEEIEKSHEFTATAKESDSSNKTATPKEYFYVNIKTKKIHRRDCRYAPSATDNNCVITSDEIQYIIDGYSWCEHCH